jgi:hypothetical protein
MHFRPVLASLGLGGLACCLAIPSRAPKFLAAPAQSPNSDKNSDKHPQRQPMLVSGSRS